MASGCVCLVSVGSHAYSVTVDDTAVLATDVKVCMLTPSRETDSLSSPQSLNLQAPHTHHGHPCSQLGN